MDQEKINEVKEELTEELRKDNADLEALETKVSELEAEQRNLLETAEAEQRKQQEEAEERRKMADAINNKEVNVKVIKEDKRMLEERNYDFDKEYRTAWAKTMLARPESEFTENEKRALGDAITTTATTFVQSTSSVQGINNGGYFIPKDVKNDILKLVYESSPFLNDVKKLQVAGNVDLPRLIAADDANWYSELSCTVNEGVEFGMLQLTGWELAKKVVVTWKLESMAVESFIPFIVEEIAQKMARALATAVIYGEGASSQKPLGAIYGLTAVTTGADPIETIINTFKSLSSDARRGAKAYISNDVNIAIAQMKDNNNAYQYLQGRPLVSLLDVVVDPFLSGNDILVGNPKNYVLNEVESVRIDKQYDVACRKVTYAGYAIYDGKPIPSAFAKGVWTPAEDTEVI